MEIQTADPAAAPAVAPHPSHLWAGKGFSFHDILDAINPLQHLPIIGTIYRHLTHDTIGNAARVVGDALYGGPIGLVMSLANVYEVDKTGKDIPDHLLAMVEGSKAKPAATPASGSVPTPAPATPAPVSIAAAPAGAGAVQAAAYAAAAGAVPAAMAGSVDPSAALAALPAPTPLAPPPAPAPASTASTLAPRDRSAARSFAIDTSTQGIASMRARTQAASGVPLEMPPGIVLSNQPQALPLPVTGLDFAQKMKQGLAKYQALLAEQAAHHPAAPQPAS